MTGPKPRWLAIAALAVALGSFSPAPSHAQESGGFAKGLNPMNWKMPEFKMPSFKTMMPGAQEQDRIIEKKDGLMSEIGKSASNSWQRTKKSLNPMNVLPIGNKSNVQTMEKKEPGFFSRFFSPPAKKGDSGTMTDFLKLDRPAP